MKTNCSIILLLLIVLMSCRSTKLHQLPLDTQKQIGSEGELPIDIQQQTQKRIDLGYHLNTIIGVVDKNGMRFYSYGQMSLTNTAKPDENSFFEIASNTKPFTTTLLADLELNGKIKINSPIELYLPVFKQVLSKSNRKVTLEDLINHTSGLPRDASNVTINDSNRYYDYTPEKLNEFLSNYKINSKKEYLYSNLAYVALERAIEVKMNESYESLTKKRILEVLDMNDTYFKVPSKKRGRLVTPFRKGKHVTELDMGIFPAAGGLKTTAKDMLRFLEAQFGQYPTSLDNAFQITHKERYSNKEETLGLAWKIMKREESGKKLLFHKGGSNGFVSFIGFNPEDQIGVIVFASGNGWFSDLGFKILDPSYPLTLVKKSNQK
ncbi:serine hydrolase domain-containing protein [Aquimarina sp. 2201CG5-10]|uniref:serine hydrolase domain-containing protein n=1 Tax=Aquimarina callyspongiae TaxID=3098150 RepID=UPI002AB41ADD|nr:serine hydrolase domain-containing protein [Aquimarina sp. 2201CG5-10]MDY8137461.1 serine hydrolase domain-containing protein [Aquimarina sp. 2201CG5-10]